MPGEQSWPSGETLPKPIVKRAVFPFQKHIMLKGFRSRGDRFTHSSGTQCPQLGSEKIHEPFIALSRYPYELLWIYCKAEKS